MSTLEREGRGVPGGRVGRPRFLHQPSSSLHFSNSTGGVLHCAATGTEQPPTITWTYKDGRPVHKVSLSIKFKLL